MSTGDGWTKSKDGSAYLRPGGAWAERSGELDPDEVAFVLDRGDESLPIRALTPEQIRQAKAVAEMRDPAEISSAELRKILTTVIAEYDSWPYAEKLARVVCSVLRDPDARARCLYEHDRQANMRKDLEAVDPLGEHRE